MSYSDFVKSRFKPGHKIAEEMHAHKAAVLSDAVLDLIASAEKLDVAKKYAIYNKWKSADENVPYVPVSDVIQFSDFTISPEQAELLHAAIGIAGEAGELLDAVWHHVCSGEPLDRENVVEELGDLEFYLMAAIQVVGILRPHLQEINVAKLTKRYENGYSDKAAQDRADKAGE